MTWPASLNILLLSESDSLASLDRRALREAGASRVDSMTSGIDAARMLAALDPVQATLLPDVVVCSQKLADMDGEQFCAILRLHPLLLDLPVLLILPNDSEVEQLKTLGCGASALLARPYSINVLKAHLDSLTTSRPSLQQLQDAQRYTDTSSFDQALATYGILLKPVRQPEDYFRVGMQCLQQRQWNNAINAFQRALRGALIQGHAELGMAVAWKGKGDMAQYRHYLGLAATTFVRARHWHQARTVYVGLLREDPDARSPFLSEAFQMMRQGQYDEAAEVLSQGHDVTPRRQLTERIAQTCLSTDEPQRMLAELEASLGRTIGMAAGPLTAAIRSTLANLTRQQEERKRQEAAENQWLAARQAARQRENAEQAEESANVAASRHSSTTSLNVGQTDARFPRSANSSQGDATSTRSQTDSAAAPKKHSSEKDAGILPVPLWGQDTTDVPETTSGLEDAAPEALSDPSRAGGDTMPLEPLAEADRANRLTDLLSVMKYTWKMARRRKE